MFKKIIDTISEHSMLKDNDKVIVGVSGGPDSVALLLILNKIKKELNLSLHIVHINYHLRGKESDLDEKFVRNLAEKLKISLTVEEVNTKEVLSKKSIQEFARNFRYKVYEKVAKEVQANKIALGHNFNDQVETVLMRFIRGAGITGLSGIPYVRNLNPNLKIIRPLIKCNREEIEKYLKKLKIKPCIDSSNLKPVYLRNKIRLELIPLIEKEYNPKFKESLFKLSEILNYEDEFLTQKTLSLYKKLIKKKNEEIEISIQKLINLDFALTFRLLRKIIEDIKGDLLGIEYKHLEGIISIIYKRAKKIELPGEIIVEKIKNHLVFRKKNKIPIISTILTINGITKMDNFSFSSKILNYTPKFKGLNNAYLNLNKISLPITIRSRKLGDRFIPFGMSGTKKLQDFFIDEKILEYKRDKIPVLVDSKNRILWIAGLRIDNRFKVTKNTKRILHIKKRGLFYC